MTILSQKASKFLNGLNLDTREKRDEIRRVIRIQFSDFCIKNGIRNTLSSYREYRSVVRSLFGFDLPVKRPKFECHHVVETNLELF